MLKLSVALGVLAALADVAGGLVWCVLAAWSATCAISSRWARVF